MASTVLFQSSPLTYPKPHFIPFHPLQSSTRTLIGSLRSSSSPKPSRFTCNCNARSTNNLNPSPNSRIEAPNNRFFGSGLGFDVVIEKILGILKGLRKPAVAIILMGLLLMYDPNSSALAASGGRVGGSAFTSRSSSSSRSSSGGGYSTSTRIIDPGVSFSAPYYAPTPFGGGGYFVGPAFGFGIGVGSNLLFILMGFAAFMLVSGMLSERDGGSVLAADSEKTTVLKLQVGLLGMARSLQEELNRIARAADTSTPQGLNYILTETTLALLRNPDYWISAYSSVDVKRSIDAGEKRFNQLSIEERGKFDEETLINVNNMKKQSSSSQKPGGFSNEYIVVTVLVAAEGVHKLPIINGSNNLKEALEKLGSIPSNRTMAVEVLWTPQDVNDTLTERELLEDYSLLRPL
ncbi:FLUCTUATING-LIGHT-ACCLIMATION protein 1, chloroplastic-like protein [Drosera capensis]